MADRTRKPPSRGGDGPVALPLPPPAEDDAAAVVRFSAERLPISADPRQEAIPALPDTGQFQRMDPHLLHDDDTTNVDPPTPMRHDDALRLPLPAQPPPLPVAKRETAPADPAARLRQQARDARARAHSQRLPRTEGATALHEEQSTAVATDPLAAMPGPLIGGRYRMVKRIGSGGMGKVYKVTHAQLGKTFALKIINTGLETDAKARESFFREARMASSLSHPNIASVVDFGEDSEFGAFMVMEFVEGEMLATLLAQHKRLSIRQACDIMLQVGEALHYIHTHRIVHCDIKAENIMVCEVPGTKRRRQVAKLLDFGLARSTTASRQTGSLSGTPHYVAPERIRGEAASPSSDIYGLGILFYELITGAVPWDGNVAQILCGHLEKTPERPSVALGEAIDPAVEQLIEKSLKKYPNERHKDVSAFLYELRTVMDMLGYGRSRKRGSRQKIVLEREASERDQMTRVMFDGNRLPMALINSQGLIVVANAAFAKFVMGVAVDVEGLTVQSTPLANTWTTFETDIDRACAGEPVRRIIEIDITDGLRRLLMWLDPAPVEDHAAFGIHPLDG